MNLFKYLTIFCHQKHVEVSDHFTQFVVFCVRFQMEGFFFANATQPLVKTLLKRHNANEFPS